MFKWPWSKKKKEADKSPKVERCVMHNTLTLTMEDGKNISWTQSDWKGKHKLDIWIDLYKWYFAKDSPYYVMQSKDSETMFKRANIKTFTVEVRKLKTSA